LGEIKPQNANRVRKLMSSTENTAGALMITEYLSYGGNMLVRDVLDDLRSRGEAYSDYDTEAHPGLSSAVHTGGFPAELCARDRVPGTFWDALQEKRVRYRVVHRLGRTDGGQ
jgi:hypothetical protein